MEPEQKSSGPIVGSIIIIIILILGGVYYLKTNIKEEPAPVNQNVGVLPGGSTLDEAVNSASAIETELNGMDLDSLDSEI